MKQIKLIEVTRAEGPSALCGTRTFDNLKSANAWLRLNALTAPKNGAYDKHDVNITFEDGETYEARMDVHHPSYERTEPIGLHIKCHCKFHGGMLKDSEIPKHLTVEQYRRLTTDKKDCESYRTFLETYNLED